MPTRYSNPAVTIVAIAMVLQWLWYCYGIAIAMVVLLLWYCYRYCSATATNKVLLLQLLQLLEN